MPNKKSYHWIPLKCDKREIEYPRDNIPMWKNVCVFLWGNRGQLWQMFVLLIILLCGSISFWHLPDSLPDWFKELAILTMPKPTYLWGAGIVTAAFIVVFFLFYSARKNDIIRRKLQSTSLHFLFHNIRDKFYDAKVRIKEKSKEIETTEINSKLSKLSKDEKISTLKEDVYYALKNFSKDVCKEIQEISDTYFAGQSLGSSVRVATVGADGTGQYYATLGRSDRLSNTRQNSTAPLLFGEGVAASLVNKNNGRGFALVLTDIQAQDIRDDGLWVPSQNDSDETVASLIAVPINSYENSAKGRESKMVGILYLTSDRKKKNCLFLEQHAEFMSAMADFLSCIYSQLLDS